MIVGKEPRSWLDNSCAGKLSQKFELENVVASLQQHEKYLKVEHPRSKFIQFYRKSCIALNGEKNLGESIIWSNLICISRHKKSAVGSKSFDQVKALSEQLLRAQIEVLKPKVILFVTGTSYDKYIRAFFPERAASISLIPGKLWSFKVDDAHCFRTSHPQWGDGAKYRDQALSLAMGKT